jgi:23S rRNA G2445 N2-methylase RlmL
MKILILVNSGLEEISKTEVEEQFNVKVELLNNVLIVNDLPGSKEDLIPKLRKLQSVRRVLVYLGKSKDIENYEFKDELIFDFFNDNQSFKIEVENVKGNDNRMEIAKTVAGKFYAFLDTKKVQPKLDLKKPDLLIDVYFNGKEYFMGIDLFGTEINTRGYRVFSHPASFKGDLAYFFVRKSGYSAGKKMLVGFSKDGTIAIEAALFSKEKISAFDPSRQNITAARKNTHLAGVKELVDFQKYSLDELDVRYSESEFDNIIFQITTKDEETINEIIYQTKYILKSNGKLMLITRESFSLPILSNFESLEVSTIRRGESVIKMSLLKKK